MYIARYINHVQCDNIDLTNKFQTRQRYNVINGTSKIMEKRRIVENIIKEKII